MKIRTNAIINNFTCLDTESKVRVFNSQCLSLYGGCLWDLRSREVIELEVAWRKSCRRILNIDRRSHNELIPHLMRTQDIRTIIEQRIINFYKNCLSHGNSLVSNVFNNSFMSSLSYFKRNFNIIIDKHKINYEDIYKDKHKFKLKIPVPQHEWKINLINQILKDRDFNNYEFLTKNQLHKILEFLCKG